MPAVPCATYSLIVRDPETGWLGSGVASKYLAVGPAVSHAMPGVGVVHAQFWCSHDAAHRILKNLAMRMPVPQALKSALAGDPEPEKRQILVMDWRGHTAFHSGALAPPVVAHEMEQDVIAAGNTLASADVIDAMLRSLRMSGGKPLLERLILALEAADNAGGDVRGKQSAAVRVIQGPEPPTSDDCLDLRVDDHPEPIAELQRLHRLTPRKA
jgi:uncharacterized Ntn-hydrolase superfamily protein